MSSSAAQCSGVYQSADDTGAYVVRISGKHVDITRYTSHSLNVGLDVSHTIAGVCAYHEKTVLFCPDYNNNQLIIYVYDMNDDSLDSFGIYGAKLLNGTDFACDDHAIYIENYRDGNELLTYSYSGDLTDRYRFDYEINSLCGAYRSGLYAVAGDSLYKLTSNGFVFVDGTAVSTPLLPVEDDVLASADGRIYLLDGNRITDTLSADTDCHAASACVIGDTVYFPNGSTINGYVLDSGDKTCYYQVSDSVNLLYADADAVTAVGDSLFVTVRRNDFIRLNQSDHIDSGNHGSVSGNASTYEHGSDSDEGSGISSDVYRIDWERHNIHGIPQSTTVAAFLSHMRYPGCTAALYRDGVLKKSGNIGTAMTAVFESNHGSVAFELAVGGDLTGEGNMNSRDLNVLLDYLNGTTSFNGVYEIAADISDDGTIDVADAALLKRQTG